MPVAKPIYIREYRVQGAHQLPPVEVEAAVYPYLGPGRTAVDVEQARAALEKAYQAKGYQTCSVVVPPQQSRGGVVFLQVIEGKVAHLRVNGARYFLPDRIKAQARSLAEGKVVNFNDVSRDIVSLNQLPDRQVTPTLIRPGDEPGTVDIDLNVKDKLPLHGSVELNNRYSADTTPLRINGALSYNNLWQAGHTLGVNFQIAPERSADGQVYSAYYVFRFPTVDWLSLMLTGTKQDSDVSSLGALDVVGRGEIIGGRAIITLPPGKNFYQSASFGMDYKHFGPPMQTNVPLTAPNGALVIVNGKTVKVDQPVTYYPISANYNATWVTPALVAKKGDSKSKLVLGSVTEFNAGLTFGLRGVGSRDFVGRTAPDSNNPNGINVSESQFDLTRSGARGNFVYLRGDLSRTQDLPAGLQAYAKVQGQVANEPLLNGEQFAGGGLDTVRGYLESEVLGDNAVVGTVELRSPPLLWFLPAKENEWRVYAFGDAAYLSIRNPLPEQTKRFDLASYGFGSRIHLADHLNGSIDAAFPLISQTTTHAHDFLLTFRVWAEF